MAIQTFKPSGGIANSKAAKVALGFVEGGPVGAGMALASNPNAAMLRRLSGSSENSDEPADPSGLGSQFAPTQQFGLGADTSMPGAPDPAQGAMARRFSLMSGSKY